MRGHRLTLLLLAAAFLVPLGLHLAGWDIAMLAVLLFGVASLLRAGEGLLDRLFLAGIVLVGVLLSAGLLFSLWPWGLSPLPVGWLLSAALVALSVLTGRSPQLPLRVEWSDAVIVGSGVGGFWATYRPLASLDSLQRLTFATTNLDRLAQFALFDTVRHLGGYAFLHQAPARVSVRTPTEVVYPQGSHFLVAVVETFLRSGSRGGAGVAELDRYFVLILGGYGLLIASVVWSARWIAGRGTSQFGGVLVCIVVAAFALLGPLAVVFGVGDDSQLFGLMFVALAAALIVRPLENNREQLVLTAALVIAVFYSYSLYGPLVVLAFGLAFALYRFPLWRERSAVALIMLPAALVALLPTMLTVAASFDIQRQVSVAGTRIPLADALLLVVGILSALPLLYPPARRGGLWRGLLAQEAAIAVVIGLFARYQSANGTSSSYYLGKLIDAGYVGLLPCLGMLGALLQRRAAKSSDGPAATDQRGNLRELPRQPGASPVATLAAAGMAVLALWLAAVQQHFPGTTVKAGQATPIPLVRWAHGQYRAVLAPTYMALSRLGVLGDRIPTLVVCSGSPSVNTTVSFFVASLNGDLGAISPALIALTTKIPGRAGRALPGQSPETVIKAAESVGGTLRVVVRDRAYATSLTKLLAGHPAVHLTVVVDPAVRVR